MDIEQGETIWQPTPEEACSLQKHLVLYEGQANILGGDSEEEEVGMTYTVEAEQKIFALRTTEKYRACSFSIFKTEHPKLLIIPNTSGRFYFPRKPLEPGALDLLAYMNAKFVFVDKSLGKNLETLHRILSYQRCIAERKMLLTQLALAYIDPNEFAYAHTGEPGYMANTAGEVIHLVACVPVEVAVRKTERCFSELPVIWENLTYFMAPKTRILQRHGTEIPCSAFVRPMYQLGGRWYALTPQITPISDPQTLSPIQPGTFHYESPAGLAAGGIYDADEVEKLREQIMHPNERQAIANVIARGMAGQRPDLQGLSIAGVMDDTALTSIQDSIVKKLWNGFTLFGSLMSGLVGIFIVARGIKWLMDTFLHGKILYDLYGLSFALIGAIWDSVTSYLVHRRAKTVIPSRQRNSAPPATVATMPPVSDDNDSGSGNEATATLSGVRVSTEEQTELYPLVPVPPSTSREVEQYVTFTKARPKVFTGFRDLEESSVSSMCLRAIAINPRCRALRREALIFFDSGADVCLMKKELAESLNLRLEKVITGPMRTLGGVVDSVGHLVTCLLERPTGKPLELTFITKRDLCGALKISLISREEATRACEGLSYKQENLEEEPDILIGLDYFWDIVKSRSETLMGAYVIWTSLGPILTGYCDDCPEDDEDPSALVVFPDGPSPRGLPWPRREDMLTRNY